MKTFTDIQRFPEGTSGHSSNSVMINVIEADPKREGLYIMRQYQVGDSYKTRKYCLMYGKKNQAAIIEASRNMIEVA